MDAVNTAIRSTIPCLRQMALRSPQCALYLNAIRFGDDARWLTERLTPIWNFHWADLEPGGLTALGAALTMVGEALQTPLILGRALPPILVLITDGLPTDDFQAGLDSLLEKPWGQRALRAAVALGKQAGSPDALEFLRGFISAHAPPILHADDAEALSHGLRRVCIGALKSTCAPDARQAFDERAGATVAETGNRSQGW